jgi:putative ABC transport system permease protein
LSDLLFNHDYFEEARRFGRGKVGWYVVEVDDARNSARMAATIDATFENSADETLTQNEQEAAQSQLKQRGDISLIVNLIMFAVFFTLLFLTGNTMLQSVRERIPEFAVLKTIGYCDRSIAMIVLAEALLICVSAALIGLLLAWCSFPLLTSITGISRLPPQVLAVGLATSAALAGVTGLPAILRLRRIRLVDALAGR